MKKTIQKLMLCAMGIATLAPNAFAQLNVPSDGSDGALIIGTNTIIDLSQAVTGTWSNNNAANAGKGVYDPAKWAVVFKYSSIIISNGATVTFANHPSHAPVVWLVQSNVMIGGAVSLNGQNIVSTYPNRLTPTEPGPGGFRGGAGDSVAGTGAGYGPGGSGAVYNSETKLQGAPYGTGYGNPQVMPLLGGSGTGGYFSSGSGGGQWAGPSGGGAILIAGGGGITVNGSITSLGNGFVFDSGFGSTLSGAGAIRLVADTIQGVGNISAGVVRTEANSISPNLILSPSTVAVPPGITPVIWPPAAAPVVTVVSVNGVSAPADPLAAVLTSSDVNISTNNAVNIIFQSQNFPPSGAIVVRVTPKYANYFNVNATFQSGTFASALWKATTTLPNGFCVLQAHATSP